MFENCRSTDVPEGDWNLCDDAGNKKLSIIEARLFPMAEGLVSVVQDIPTNIAPSVGTATRIPLMLTAPKDMAEGCVLAEKDRIGAARGPSSDISSADVPSHHVTHESHIEPKMIIVEQDNQEKGFLEDRKVHLSPPAQSHAPPVVFEHEWCAKEMLDTFLDVQDTIDSGITDLRRAVLLRSFMFRLSAELEEMGFDVEQALYLDFLILKNLCSFLMGMFGDR
ncbi:hypothetical protein BSKO_14085 [Bryopsis sp. KO-2023]|nr:hypothetical protein BSKO_14085 [Bryopsis sp. KO-2023]